MKHLAACLAALFLALSLPALAQDGPQEEAAMAAEALATVNVNEADAEAIADALVGIGLSKAQAIVDYREQYGRFYSAEELTAVKGIGRATVAKNHGRIKVE